MINCVLVSMPWAAPMRPSIQTGVLKAYLDSVFKEEVSTTAVPAHLGIPFEVAGAGFLDIFTFFEQMGETFYLLLYYRQFGFPNLSYNDNILNAALEKIATETNNENLYVALDRLHSATNHYIDNHICKHISDLTQNIVSFTVNFHQLYSSLYCIQYLLKYHPSNYQFVLGGMTMSLPRVNKIIRKLNIDANIIRGEGEKQLEKLIKTCLASVSPRTNSPSSLPHSLQQEIIPSPYACNDNQLNSLNSLLQPNYDEYFSLLGDVCDSRATYSQLKQSVTVLAEGSRGCLFSCDYCGFNSAWSGYRSKTARQIFKDVSALCVRHGISRVYFVDNLCDLWAKEYAEILIDKGMRINSFMELRSKHEETFWVALKLSGVERIQVGIEALSPKLLEAMNKKTRVIDNLKSIKYLSELGIKSSANLITHHPKSTSDDISITSSILKLIPHFQPFTLSGFALCYGSPLFHELPSNLQEISSETIESKYITEDLEEYFTDWRHDYPKGTGLSDELKKEWTQFSDWYSTYQEEAQNNPIHLTQTRLAEGAILVRDGRKGKEFQLSGELERLYEFGHAGPRIDDISCSTGITEKNAKKHLDFLIENNLIILSEDHFLSLAMREETELIVKFFRQRHPPNELYLQGA